MNREIESFLASRKYSENTKTKYRRILDEFVQLQDLAGLDAVGLLAWLDRPGWGNSQRIIGLSACKMFLAWLYGRSHPALTATIKRVRSPQQPTLSQQRALELLMYFDARMPKGCRDLAIAALALDTGLRASELARLDVKYLNLEDLTLQVIVKGGQWGMAVFSDVTAGYLADWLKVRKAAPGVGNVFVSMHHVRKGLPLSRDGLRQLVNKWGADLGFALSPHDLRRSFATLSTVFGAPSRLVMEAGRWSSMEMVEHYTRAIRLDAFRPYLLVNKLKQG